jgi:hypothetical protein
MSKNKNAAAPSKPPAETKPTAKDIDKQIIAEKQEILRQLKALRARLDTRIGMMERILKKGLTEDVINGRRR